MKKWVTAIAVLVGLSAVGLLVYRQWDPIWTFVLSPVGGFVLKVVFSAKVLKFAVAGAVAVAAGAVAVRRKLRREAPEPELAPPVYGPPEEEPPGAPAMPGAPAALTPGGTETATTTESPRAPASQPI